MVGLLGGFDCLRRVWRGGDGVIARAAIVVISLVERIHAMLHVFVVGRVRVVFLEWVRQGTAPWNVADLVQEIRVAVLCEG